MPRNDPRRAARFRSAISSGLKRACGDAGIETVSLRFAVVSTVVPVPGALAYAVCLPRDGAD